MIEGGYNEGREAWKEKERNGKNKEEREKKLAEIENFKQIHILLFNGISTPYGLFHAEISFTSKSFITIITLYLMFIALYNLSNHLFTQNYMVSSIPIKRK